MQIGVYLRIEHTASLRLRSELSYPQRVTDDASQPRGGDPKDSSATPNDASDDASGRRPPLAEQVAAQLALIASREALVADLEKVVRAAEDRLIQVMYSRADPDAFAEYSARVTKARRELDDSKRALRQQRARWEALAPRARAADVATRDVQALKEKLRKMRSVVERNTRPGSKVLFVAQIVALLLAALASILVAPHTGSRVKLDFYAAAAGIIPLLLVAGFVELTSVAPSGATWSAMALGLPAVVGETAALVALGSGASRFPWLVLSSYGIAATGAALFILVPLHGAQRRAGRVIQDLSRIALGDWSEALKQETTAIQDLIAKVESGSSGSL